jgi:hypothetical protein
MALDQTAKQGSNPLGLIDRPLVPHIARVQRCRRLEQQDVCFLLGHRAMLDASGNDQELTILQHRALEAAVRRGAEGVSREALLDMLILAG